VANQKATRYSLNGGQLGNMNPKTLIFCGSSDPAIIFLGKDPQEKSCRRAYSLGHRSFYYPPKLEIIQMPNNKKMAK
jgi:hypothetical protein